MEQKYKNRKKKNLTGKHKMLMQVVPLFHACIVAVVASA
jgi:nitrogen fixation protein FixH